MAVGWSSNAWLLLKPDNVTFWVATAWTSLLSCDLTHRNSAHPHDVHAVFMPVTSFFSQCSATAMISSAGKISARIASLQQANAL